MKKHFSNAIAGAIARMSKKSNRSQKHFYFNQITFGDWDDWDNGHSDGPSD